MIYEDKKHNDKAYILRGIHSFLVVNLTQKKGIRPENKDVGQIDKVKSLALLNLNLIFYLWQAFQLVGPGGGWGGQWRWVFKEFKRGGHDYKITQLHQYTNELSRQEESAGACRKRQLRPDRKLFLECRPLLRKPRCLNMQRRPRPFLWGALGPRVAILTLHFV